MISHLQLASEKQARSHPTYEPCGKQKRVDGLCLWESRCEDCVRELARVTLKCNTRRAGSLVTSVARECVQFDSDYSVEDDASPFSSEVCIVSYAASKDTTNIQLRPKRLQMTLDTT